MPKKNFEKIDDFIFAVKDKSVKEIFFKFIPNSQKIILQTQDKKEAEGFKHTINVFLSAISEDEKTYITYFSPLMADSKTSQILELVQSPITTDKEINDFNIKASKLMQTEIIEKLQKEYGGAELKAGDCSPLVK